MRIVLQRVISASVSVADDVIGKIQKGYVLFLGVCASDTKAQADRLADKIAKLRIFPDENDKINLSIADVGGGILIISQFTLYADCRKGNRPSFTDAAGPGQANELYEYFLKACEGRFQKVAHGSFGAHMNVELVNDGPFTLVLEDAAT